MHKHKFEALGSIFEFFIIDCNDDRIISELVSSVQRFEQAFSRFIVGNQLGILNANLGNFIEISEEMYLLLKFAQKFFVDTDGYFDVSIMGALENLGYDKTYSFVENYLSKNETELLIEFQNQQVRINKKIEFGGFGKGYVLDKLKSILIDNGYRNFLLNAGGDICAYGIGPNKEGWKIVLEDPLSENNVIGEIVTTDLFVAASSSKKRKWKNHHHLIGKDWLPVNTDIEICFVQSDTGIASDAMATAIFVGSQIPTYVDALCILKDRKVVKTEGFNCSLYK